MNHFLQMAAVAGALTAAAVGTSGCRRSAEPASERTSAPPPSSAAVANANAIPSASAPAANTPDGSSAAPAGAPSSLPLERWPAEVHGFANHGDLATFQRACVAGGGTLDGAHKIQCLLPHVDGQPDLAVARGVCPDDGVSLCEYLVTATGAGADADGYDSMRRSLLQSYGPPSEPGDQAKHVEQLAALCRPGHPGYNHVDLWRFGEGPSRRAMSLVAQCDLHSQAPSRTLEWVMIYEYPQPAPAAPSTP